MKLLTNILKKWIKDLPDDINVITNALTSLAYEVENFYLASNVSGPKVVKTLSCSKHPNADKLSVCEIIDFKENKHTVVCGADNIDSNQIVVWAPPGSKVGDFKLEKKELRGVVSEGMILSYSEIGGFDKSFIAKKDRKEIVVFNDENDLNFDPISRLSLDGYVIEISILPDRQYANNFKTIAKELSVYLDLDFEDEIIEIETIENRDLELKNNATALAFSKIKISNNGIVPFNIKSALVHNQINLENSLLDLMKYFHLINGNPTYILDNERLKLDNNKLNNIDTFTSSLKLKDGFLTTFSSDFKTNPMLIKNIDNTFGFKNTKGVSNQYFLETLKEIIYYGKKFNLIESYSKINFNKKDSRKIIGYSKENIEKIIGSEIDISYSIKKLENLDFKFSKNEVEIPFYRKDMESIQDIVEEILRFIGIEKISPIKPTKTELNFKEKHKVMISKINNLMNIYGINEVKTYQLISSDNSNEFSFWNIEKNIELKDDFNVENNTMQKTLLNGLIKVFSDNYRNKKQAKAIYEVQNVFYDLNKPSLHLGVLLSNNYQEDTEETLILKFFLEEIYNSKIDYRECNNNSFNKFNSSYAFDENGDLIAVLGEIHPKILRDYKFIKIDKVKEKLFYLEIDVEKILKVIDE